MALKQTVKSKAKPKVKRAAKRIVKATTKPKAVRKTAAKTKAASSPKSVTKKTIQKDVTPLIQQKAYQLFERRGYREGYEQFDWEVAQAFVALEEKYTKAAKKTKVTDLETIQRRIADKAYQLSQKAGYNPENDQFNWNVARELVLMENNLAQDLPV